MLIGGGGADALYGGNGFEIASYESATNGVLAHTDDYNQNIGEAAGDTYFSIEGLRGSAFDDQLIIVANGGKAWGGELREDVRLLLQVFREAVNQRMLDRAYEIHANELHSYQNQ